MLHAVTNVPRDYAWGDTELIARLQGREPSGKPEAEVWFGDHPGDPADLADGRDLRAVTGGSLPYLLKLLAAGSPLSIQVHPNLQQAREGFAREAHLEADDPTRNYRDDNHKPELIVALSDSFEALCGLRPLEDTRRILSALPQTPGVQALAAVLNGNDPVRAALRWVLAEASESEVASVHEALASADLEQWDAPDAADVVALRSIAAHYPGDRGVIVALMMNRVVLSRGEGLFLGAGNVHAYLSGLGVEIMSASDNVLRGGLTPKRIDVDELLSIVDPTPLHVDVQDAESAAVQVYRIPVDDFALRRITVGEQKHTVMVHAPAMVLATAGSVVVSGNDGVEHPVAVGTAVMADGDETELVLSGSGEVFIAEPGGAVRLGIDG
ncbi:mannose-6-phosphate isomerase, class I [Microbacterium sp. YY-01]|uniref:mannose-6-phosphate isomerase, class I n=1 Tax=Microbacterium sp. YY-01 TaxID=3421634 RepID=UPI003D176D89